MFFQCSASRLGLKETRRNVDGAGIIVGALVKYVPLPVLFATGIPDRRCFPKFGPP